MLSHKTSFPILLAILTGTVSASGRYAKVSGELSSQPCLQVRNIIEAAKSLGSANSFDIASGLFVEDSARAVVELTAFEENQSFVYAVARIAPPMGRSTAAGTDKSHARQ